MKKLFITILAIPMALSLAACGGNTTEPSTAPASSTAPSSQSVAEPSSTAPVSTVTDSKYKIEVKLLDDKKAAVVIGGAAPTSEMVGTHWGVKFDNQYAVRLDVEDGFFHCASWKLAADMSSSRLSNMNFTIADDALILYADFGGEADFRFADVKEVILIIDDIADTEFRYDPVTLAMADVVVEEITVTAAKIEMPVSKGESSEASAEAPPVSSQPDIPQTVPDASANQYVGVYTGKSGRMTVTSDSITVVSQNVEYRTSYTLADISDNNGIGMITYTTNGVEVLIAFGRDGQLVEVYINQKGEAYTRGDTSQATGSEAATSSFAAMAGTYRGGWTTLTISADGSFTYADTKLGETLSGVLPDGAKSGVTLTLGSYTVKFNFPEDFSYFSTDIKDASGMSVSGDDMSRG